MKWFKRILFFVAVVVFLAIVGIGTAIYMYHSAPRWYRPRVVTAEQQLQTANSAQQKLWDLISWVGSIHAQAIRENRGNASTEPLVGPKTVKYSDDEFEQLYRTWVEPNAPAFDDEVAKYFTDGRLVFDDDELIIAGQSKDVGALISVVFEPTIDETGALRMKLYSIDAGRLPIPQSMLGNELEKVKSKLMDRLQQYQQTADIDKDLVANKSAVDAAMTRLLLDSLNDQPSDPILYLPYDIGNLKKTIPVKVAAMKLQDGSMMLTLQPLTTTDRTAVLDRLKKPYELPTPAGQ
jgi:hypothetical protein